MADFTVIETQEQLDKIIGERLERAKASAAKEFEPIKAQNEEYAKQVESLTKELNDTKAKYADVDKKIESLEKQNKEYETASVKSRIANEVGLPYGLAARLVGADEDAIRADAEAMVKLVGKGTAPLGTGEGANARDPYRELLKSMKGN